ncbi:ATP-binding protein [Nonomuraea insulae]|uniref:ATP-binding protein n=1 Tax=Nonomuraea insulae TaxID=1616787 RepID=A0ABW1D5H7_9ACTN
MGFAVTSSAVVIGLAGHLVRIEADVRPGPPGFQLIGLPDTTTAPIRDRVRAAILNSGYTWPEQQVTVTVLPFGLPAYGSALDAAIAMAVLATADLVPTSTVARTAFLGELGLDGSLRHVRGLTCAIRTLTGSGISAIAVPAASTDHTGQWAVIPAACLADLVDQLNNGPTLTAPPPAAIAEHAPGLDLADLPGNQPGKRALEIAAAGGHHLLLHGRGPAAGLAACLPALLPPLDAAAQAEIYGLYALTETLSPGHRPLCTPHYTTTVDAIFGRSTDNVVRPGAVSLAHTGVLFLDDAPEFARSVLDGLRYPLDTGEIILAGTGGIVRLPARFHLVLATHPCPCPAGSCRCTPVNRQRSPSDGRSWWQIDGKRSKGHLPIHGKRPLNWENPVGLPGLEPGTSSLSGNSNTCIDHRVRHVDLAEGAANVRQRP